MEKNYMNPNVLIEFEFLEDKRADVHTHENPELLFVLEGCLHVKTDQQEYTLRSEDFLMINANRKHKYVSEGALLAVRFMISITRLKEMLHQNTILFWCSSLSDNNIASEEVRKTLKEILLCSINRGEKDEFYLNGLYYRLLSHLCGNYLLEQDQIQKAQSTDEGRMDQILDYIRLNYQESISLQEVADAFFISPTYLSKYIRKNSGKGFVDLINQVRLSHALEDLLYTDNSVTKIAMDNGFPSVATLNKVFKETYQTTPSEYRKEKKKDQSEKASGIDEDALRKTAVYLHQHYQYDKNAREKNEVSLSLSGFEGGKKVLAPLFNGGKARDLSTAFTQKLILQAKEQLGVRYVRIWNFMDPEMYLDRNSRKGKLNFGKLDQILDFLTANDLCPYFELRSKDMRVFEDIYHLLQSEKRIEDFENNEERSSFLRELTGHFGRRFGPAEVSRWIFNYEIKADTSFENGRFVFYPTSDEDWNKYLEEFAVISSVLKERFPAVRVGGAGFPVQHFGEERLRQLFTVWNTREQKPDFISFTSFPYQIVQDKGVWYERRRTNFRFVENDVNAVLKAAEDSGLNAAEFHLTEFNLTLSDRTFINDSAVRGAFAADILVRLYDKVHLAGIWNISDSYSELADSADYLYGGSGILTKTGAAKPAYIAMNLANRLYEENVMADESCLITRNHHGHFKLLVHNLVNMNTAYYLKEENEVSAMEVDRMTETDQGKTIHVRAEGLRDGCWQIRKYCMHRQCGSVLNEWVNLGQEAELSREELVYLERISIPRLFAEKLHTKDGVLEFDIDLEPNEVQYLHITEFN